MRPRTLATLLLCTLGACDGGGAADELPPPPSAQTSTQNASGQSSTAEVVPPSVEGAVLTVAGRPILRSELEELADAAALVSPEYTRAHDRRLALEMHLIPRAALAAAHGPAREEARAKALGALEQLEARPHPWRGRNPEGLDIRLEQADVRQLGLPLWYALEKSPRGAWVGPVEDLGRWRMGRWIAMSDSPSPGTRTYDCELLDYWFLPEEHPIPFVNAALAQAELLVHDAAIGELITERTRWRMKQR